MLNYFREFISSSYQKEQKSWCFWRTQTNCKTIKTNNGFGWFKHDSIKNRRIVLQAACEWTRVRSELNGERPSWLNGLYIDLHQKRKTRKQTCPHLRTVSLRWPPGVWQQQHSQAQVLEKEEVNDYLSSTIRPTNHPRQMISQWARLLFAGGRDGKVDGIRWTCMITSEP